MMKLVLESFSSDKLVQLDNYANNKISVRGYDPRNDVPVDYRNPQFYLPFNEIPIKYCPTDRYSFLHKYERNASTKPTWESLKGKIIDDLYDYFIKRLQNYCERTTHQRLDIAKNFQRSNKKYLKTKHNLMQSKIDGLQNPPSADDIANFERLLEKVLRYETQLASTLIDYKISMNEDMEVRSANVLLFPFITKPTFTVMGFGITNKAQPDFLFDNRVIIDVKSSPWRDDFYNTLAGYALAYEKSTGRPMNLGVIIMPELHTNRNVPFYFKSEIITIDDRLRKAFLLRRENLLELMKNKVDPGVPENNTQCKTCMYFTHCFQEL